MKKIRYYLAVIALLATLSGPALQVFGAGSMANTASSQHTSASFAAGHTTKFVRVGRYPPCPSGGTSDC